MADLDLASLVARARKGDRAAFEKIVQRTTRLVYAQIVARVRDRQRAEDLTQETFVSAWKGLGSIKGNGTRSVSEGLDRGPFEKDLEKAAGGGSAKDAAAGFVPWLLTVARNVTLDAAKFEGRQKRDVARRVAGDAAEELPDGQRSPHDAAELTEARDHALRVLEELPEEYRAPLSLRYLAGMEYEAIRAQLELTDGALRGLLNRGMALLRERMGAIKK